MKILSKLENKKIAVIGKGYIGSNLIEFLNKYTSEYAFSVYGFNIDNILDIYNQEFDYVFNCAGNSGDFRKNVLETIESNIGLNISLLKNLKINEKLIYMSSVRVYGFSVNSNIIFDENFINCKDNREIDYIYDGTKKLTESILINYSSNINYNINIVRLSNVYGNFNKLDDATLIKKIIRLKNENKRLSLPEHIYHSTKDYVFIEDAIIGIIKAAVFGKNCEIYNIASGKSYSVKEIANLIGLKTEIVKSNITTIHSKINISKSKNEIDFNPQIDIKRGLIT